MDPHECGEESDSAQAGFQYQPVDDATRDAAIRRYWIYLTFFFNGNGSWFILWPLVGVIGAIWAYGDLSKGGDDTSIAAVLLAVASGIVVMSGIVNLILIMRGYLPSKWRLIPPVYTVAMMMGRRPPKYWLSERAEYLLWKYVETGDDRS